MFLCKSSHNCFLSDKSTISPVFLFYQTRTINAIDSIVVISPKICYTKSTVSIFILRKDYLFIPLSHITEYLL